METSTSAQLWDALAHLAAGRLDQAESCCREGLAATECHAIPPAPPTDEPVNTYRCRILVRCGVLAAHTGLRYEAEDCYRKALTLAERIWDPYHEEVASICHRLALLAEGWEDGDALLTFAHRAYHIRCSLFGSTHPLTAAARTGTAVVLHAKGEYSRAGEAFVHALGLFDRHYLTSDTTLAAQQTLDDYATCLRGASVYLISNGRAADAREFSSRAVHAFVSLLGKRHPQTRQLRAEHDSIARAASRQQSRFHLFPTWNWWRLLSFSR
jgi:tetratricopeptide (TPR) repeat protein